MHFQRNIPNRLNLSVLDNYIAKRSAPGGVRKGTWVVKIKVNSRRMWNKLKKHNFDSESIPGSLVGDAYVADNELQAGDVYSAKDVRNACRAFMRRTRRLTDSPRGRRVFRRAVKRGVAEALREAIG